jgi:hypothetical protein
MTTAEISPNNQLAKQARQAYMAARQRLDGYRLFSFRDQTRATEQAATTLESLGPVQHLARTVLAATETCGPLVVHAATVRRSTGKQTHMHEIRLTTALSPAEQTDEAVQALHGLGQNPNSKGTARLLHNHLARQFAGATVLSVCLENTGAADHGLTKLQSLRGLPLPAAAEARLAIGRHIAGDKATHIVSNSLGTIYGAHALRLNQEKEVLNIASFHAIAPVYLEPVEAPRILLGTFVPYWKRVDSSDAPWNQVDHQDECPLELEKVPLVPWLGHVAQLMRGTPDGWQYEFAGTGLPMQYIYGNEDPAAKPSLYRSVQAAHPDNVNVIELDAGHYVTHLVPDLVAQIHGYTRSTSDTTA